MLAKYKAVGFRNLHYTYNLLSVNNHLKGNYDKALYYALLAIESMQETKDTASARIFYSHIAGLYHELGQSEKSIEYYRIFFELPRPIPPDIYYLREADGYIRDLIKQNRPQEALDILVDISKKNPPQNSYDKASLARTFAYYYTAVKNERMAEIYSQQMISLEKLLGSNNELRRDVAYDIGKYYLGKKQFVTAATYFETALNEALLNNSVNAVKEVSLMLFKTDSSRGKYLSAIKHLNLYRQLNDSIFNEAKSKRIEEIKVKYETEKKEQIIKLLENESMLQQNKILQAKYTRNSIIRRSRIVSSDCGFAGI